MIVKKRCRYFVKLLLMFLFWQFYLFSSVGIAFIQPKNKSLRYLYTKINLHKNNTFNDFYLYNRKITPSKNSVKTDVGENTPWSNAFNFKKIWGTQIDPRTGILSAHVRGSLLSNLARIFHT